eukprot:363318-Chlamydomonas_euryale.AAC.1
MLPWTPEGEGVRRGVFAGACRRRRVREKRERSWERRAPGYAWREGRTEGAAMVGGARTIALRWAFQCEPVTREEERMRGSRLGNACREKMGAGGSGGRPAAVTRMDPRGGALLLGTKQRKGHRGAYRASRPHIRVHRRARVRRGMVHKITQAARCTHVILATGEDGANARGRWARSQAKQSVQWVPFVELTADGPETDLAPAATQHIMHDIPSDAPGGPPHREPQTQQAVRTRQTRGCRRRTGEQGGRGRGPLRCRCYLMPLPGSVTAIANSSAATTACTASPKPPAKPRPPTGGGGGAPPRRARIKLEAGAMAAARGAW